MDVASTSSGSSAALSPLSSPHIGALLKFKIIAWTQETGFPVSVRVKIGEKVLELHKQPLGAKSGYLKKALSKSTELELLQNFPGGLETFEMVALFSYGFSTIMDPFNVAALRCAAEFLEMTEDYSSGNLCEQSDLYLNQVVLQNWDDTLIVLQKCQSLLPWSEDLLIVSRCIESIAFMACMEILDPDRKRSQPVVSLEALASQPWSCENVKEIVSQDLMIKDLIALPFVFFKRIIGSLRKQGMKEKYVSPIIVFYANKWVLSKKIHQFLENTGDRDNDDDANNKILVILQGLLDLLPMEEKANRVIPVGFYFALLSRSLKLNLSSGSKAKLQDQIASQLQFAQVDDFLLPESITESISSSVELATMENIISTYISSNTKTTYTPSGSSSLVAELWDRYLSLIAPDTKMGPRRFMDLNETVPISDRQTHDNLYRAIDTFLLEHTNITQEEKASVCRYLNCQKLSQETCIEAVQNDLMPLRLIVQALFAQQLNTHQAFKDCSDSFRYTHWGEFSGSLSSSILPNSKSQNTESPYNEVNREESVSKPLDFLLQKEVTLQSTELSRKEYESTSFRIQHLEQELISLKRSLKQQTVPKVAESSPAKPQTVRPHSLGRKVLSKKRNPLGQVTSCIGSVSFASQRKYASRMLKVFQRIALFGRGKMKGKPGAPSLWPKSL